VVVLGLGFAARAEDQPGFKGDPYTLGVCSVSGEVLGSMGDPVSLVQDGRDIKFCCSGCPPKFAADPAKYLSKIDSMMIADQKPHYPLSMDLVTGEALPAEDKVLDIVHFNRLVRLGSQKSVQAFMKDPDTYLAKLNAAVIAKQEATYPTDKCVVSGEKLGAADKVQAVYANRLLQFCCNDCVKDFVNSPAKYLSMLEKGETPKPGSGPHEGHDAHK
jgi:YHS domain-containing protein